MTHLLNTSQKNLKYSDFNILLTSHIKDVVDDTSLSYSFISTSLGHNHNWLTEKFSSNSGFGILALREICKITNIFDKHFNIKRPKITTLMGLEKPYVTGRAHDRPFNENIQISGAFNSLMFSDSKNKICEKANVYPSALSNLVNLRRDMSAYNVSQIIKVSLDVPRKVDGKLDPLRAKANNNFHDWLYCVGKKGC